MNYEKIKKMEQKINRDDLIYKTDNKRKSKICDFQTFKTIRSVGNLYCCYYTKRCAWKANRLKKLDW